MVKTLGTSVVQYVERWGEGKDVEVGYHSLFQDTISKFA